MKLSLPLSFSLSYWSLISSPTISTATTIFSSSSDEVVNSRRLFWRDDDFPKVLKAIVPAIDPNDASGVDFSAEVDLIGVEGIVTNEDGSRSAKIKFIVHDRWESLYLKGLALKGSMTFMLRGKKSGISAASNIEVDDALTKDLHNELNIAQNNEDSPSLRSNTYESIRGYPCYKSVKGTFDWMQDMSERAASIPNLSIEIKDIGDSYLKSVDNNDGYDIFAMIITGNGAPSVGTKSVFFAMTGIHAREYTPTELASRWAEEDLINQYGKDTDITAMLDRTEIHLVIQSNPDGRNLAETQKWQLRRKNANTEGKFLPCFFSTRGVDLNRNFPFRWEVPGGSSTNQCAQTYRGVEPASEPETQAIVNYCKDIFPAGQRKVDPTSNQETAYREDAMGVFFDMHSFGDLLIWPWGHKNEITKNDEDMTALANKYKYFNGYTYAGPQQEDFLYEASGVSVDWAYGELGAAAMTFELGTSFYQSCDYFEESILEVNKKVLTYAAKISSAPYSLPKGPDITDANLSANDDFSFLTIVVTASDSSNTANTHPMAGQDVIEISAFVDNHPYDLLEAGTTREEIVVLENPSDGNSTTVTATKIIDISDLAEGKHIIYLIAKDSMDYKGPVTAYSFEKPMVQNEQLSLEVSPATNMSIVEEKEKGDMATTSTTINCNEKQDDLIPFYVEQLEEKKNCLWLSQNMEHFGFLCKYFETFKNCPRTCDKCDVIEAIQQKEDQNV